MQIHRTPAAVGTGVVVGVDAVPVVVEATMRGDTTPMRVLGSVDAVVREGFPRILSAFAAQGLAAPRGSPLVNLLPANVRKAGSAFDLPIALALAGAGGVLQQSDLLGLAALGEVSLEGRILPARGAVAVALAARARGWTRLLLHPDDARAAAVVPDLDVIAVETLADAVIGLGYDRERLVPLPRAGAATALEIAREPRLDLADVRGHETPKTALVVAAAGRHNLLLVGPPGSGKSALLQRIGTLMPPPAEQECLEILKIRSVAGAARFATRGGRPFRAPHHSSSAASVLGGGADPRPGEVTLAQHGVLFLDELPEFRREVLEGLRQPLEDRVISIGRVQRTVTMPADFLLVAAMNPCPCGFAGDMERTCTCPGSTRQRYRSRISGPLLDRFDLQVAVPSVPEGAWHEARDVRWSSAALRARVERAVERQRERNPGAVPNSRLDGRELEAVLGEDPDRDDALSRVSRAQQLSGRGRVRVLRTARTLADLDGEDVVRAIDVLRAARVRQDPLR